MAFRDAGVVDDDARGAELADGAIDPSVEVGSFGDVGAGNSALAFSFSRSVSASAPALASTSQKEIA